MAQTARKYRFQQDIIEAWPPKAGLVGTPAATTVRTALYTEDCARFTSKDAWPRAFGQSFRQGTEQPETYWCTKRCASLEQSGTWMCLRMALSCGGKGGAVQFQRRHGMNPDTLSSGYQCTPLRVVPRCLFAAAREAVSRNGRAINPRLDLVLVRQRHPHRHAGA